MWSFISVPFHPCVGTSECSPKEWSSGVWITINGSEYLLSQYADDSALILGDDKYFLEQALNIFDYFSVCAGLLVSLDKTEAICVGSRLGSDNKLLPEKHLAWNTSGNLKLLLIHFNLNRENKTLENVGEEIIKIKNILSSWHTGT